MYYAPHILFKRVIYKPVISSNGHPVFSEEEGWKEICRCRCDDSDGTEIRKEDGSFYKPRYHVVCEGRDIDIEAGDYIKAEWRDGTLRGEGEVQPIPRRTNHYDYTEFNV